MRSALRWWHSPRATYPHSWVARGTAAARGTAGGAPPALLGPPQVIVGALLGPPMADVVPQPAAVALVGQLGLVLLVVESGLEVEACRL